MSENLREQEIIDSIPETPTDPNEVASAARGCSVILILFAAMVVVLLIWVAVAIAD